jgi:hypothetical protein
MRLNNVMMCLLKAFPRILNRIKMGISLKRQTLIFVAEQLDHSTGE